jgi:hypothetical protein
MRTLFWTRMAINHLVTPGMICEASSPVPRTQPRDVQDEVLDTVYWMRQIIALLCGIIWGGVPLKGLPAFIA